MFIVKKWNVRAWDASLLSIECMASTLLLIVINHEEFKT